LVSEAPARRVGNHRSAAHPLAIRAAVLPSALARPEAQWPDAGDSGRGGAGDALCRSVLDDRPRLLPLRGIPIALDGCGGPARPRWDLAGTVPVPAQW